MTGETYQRPKPAPLVSQAHAKGRRAGSVRRVFIRDMVLACSIGVHRYERESAQRVRINLELAVEEGEAPLDDELANVVCYETVVQGVRAVVARSRVKLVETLAEAIAEVCLEDRRVRTARVRIEKLDAFADVASVGVEIERQGSEV